MDVINLNVSCKNENNIKVIFRNYQREVHDIINLFVAFLKYHTTGFIILSIFCENTFYLYTKKSETFLDTKNVFFRLSTYTIDLCVKCRESKVRKIYLCKKINKTEINKSKQDDL